MHTTNSLKSWSRKWFGNRMPVGREIKLSQKSTYIWPTRTGYLIIFVLFLMLVGATNYQNNLAFMLTFLLVGIGLVSIIFTFKNLQGIIFTALPVDEVFVGQVVKIPVSLSSAQKRSHFTIGVGENDKSCQYTDVSEHQFSQLQVEFSAKKRGHFVLPRLMATSEFPFGWLRTWAYFRFDIPVIIYPLPEEPEPQAYLNSGHQTDEGESVPGSEDLSGLAVYQPGDSLSKVDWKAFARERGMFVREFSNYQSKDYCFNWHDFVGVTDELRLSYLTHLVLEAAKQCVSYSLVLPGKTIGFQSGYSHRQNCLRSLALYGLNEENGLSKKHELDKKNTVNPVEAS